MNKFDTRSSPHLHEPWMFAKRECPLLRIEGRIPLTKILRLPAVMQATGLSKASVYLGVKKGTFPPPVKLGERAVGWPDDVIGAWVKSRPQVVA